MASIHARKINEEGGMRSVAHFSSLSSSLAMINAHYKHSNRLLLKTIALNQHKYDFDFVCFFTLHISYKAQVYLAVLNLVFYGWCLFRESQMCVWCSHPGLTAPAGT